MLARELGMSLIISKLISLKYNFGDFSFIMIIGPLLNLLQLLSQCHNYKTTKKLCLKNVVK